MTESRGTKPAHPDARYADLIAREAEHWGRADRDPSNPQLWDDPVLYQRVLAEPYERLLAGAVATGGPALELGCGDGDLAPGLGRGGPGGLGLDPSPLPLEAAPGGAKRARAESRAGDQGAGAHTTQLQ